MQLSKTVHHCGWQQVSNTQSLLCNRSCKLSVFKSLWMLAIYFAFLGNIKHETKLTERLPWNDECNKKCYTNMNWLNSSTCYAECKKLLHYINHLADAFITHMRKNNSLNWNHDVSSATILNIKSKPERYKPRAHMCVPTREKQVKSDFLPQY